MRHHSTLLFVATVSSAIALSSNGWSQNAGRSRQPETPTGRPPAVQTGNGPLPQPQPATLDASGAPGSNGALPGQPAEDVSPQPRVTLADAVKAALKRNPTAVTAEEEVHRAYALMEEARAQSLPTLNGYGAYTALDHARAVNGVITTPKDTLTANVTLSVPIVYAQKWVLWDHAGENLAVQKFNEKDVKRSVAIATARAYLTVIAQRRLLAAAELARANAQGHYDYAHARLVGGIGNRIDEVRAAQELHTDEAQVQQAATGVVRAREALTVLAGSDSVIDATNETDLANPPAQGAISEKTLDDRPDIAARIRNVQAQDRWVNQDWTDYMPFLTANGLPFYQGPATASEPHTGWEIQLLLTVPLYDGGYRYGLAKERKALADEAKTALDGALRQARSDVRVSYEALQRAESGLDSSRRAAKSAKDALDLANIAYRAGAATNIEVIDAEQQFRDAEVNAAVAEDTERQAKLDVLSTAGVFP